jgi:hypothetical protein
MVSVWRARYLTVDTINIFCSSEGTSPADPVASGCLPRASRQQGVVEEAKSGGKVVGRGLLRTEWVVSKEKESEWRQFFPTVF